MSWKAIGRTWRLAWSRPHSAVTIVAVVGAASGMAAAMFAIVSPIIVGTVPYSKPEELVVLHEFGGERGGLEGSPTVEDVSRRVDLFVAVAAFEDVYRSARLRGPDGAHLVRVATVSPTFFNVLGSSVPGLSHEALLWRNPSPLVMLPERPQTPSTAASGVYTDVDTQATFEIAGGAPPGFVFPIPNWSRRPDAVAIAAVDELVAHHGPIVRRYSLIARVHPGLTPTTVAERLAASPQWKWAPPKVTGVAEYVTASVRPVAWVALLSCVLIMAASVANAVNLAAIAMHHRAREFDVRHAVGATTRHVMSQLVAENAVLLVSSIVLGIGVGYSLVSVCLPAVPAQYLLRGESRVARDVVASVILLCLCAGAAILLAATVTVHGRIRLGGMTRDAAPSRVVRIVGSAIQSAIAMLLIIGASILVRSSINIWLKDTGFAADALVAEVSYPPSLSPAALAAHINTTLGAVRSVAPRGLASVVAGPFIDATGVVGGYQLDISGRRVAILPKEVTPEYATIVGATVRRGRWLVDSDRGWESVVIDEALADRLWPGVSYATLLGKTFRVIGQDTGGRIVGIVKSMYDRALDKRPAGTLFRPVTAPLAGLPVNYIIPTSAGDQQIEVLLRRAIAEPVGDAVILGVTRLENRLAGTVRVRDTITVVLVAFAVIATVVTASGLIGLISFMIIRRTKEVAIRRVLGASGLAVMRVVVGEAVASALTGAVVGMIAGVMCSKVLSGYVFGMRAQDPLSIAVGSLLVVFVILVTSAIVALRAVSIAPSRALRME